MTKSNRQDDMRDYIIHPDNVQTSVKHGQLRFEMELTGSVVCRVYDVALD